MVIVFGNQATTYPNRERQRFGSARPSLWLIGSSVVDLLIASTLATCGIAMAPLPIFVVGGTLVAAAVFAVILDFAKVPLLIAFGSHRERQSNALQSRAPRQRVQAFKL